MLLPDIKGFLRERSHLSLCILGYCHSAWFLSELHGKILLLKLPHALGTGHGKRDVAVLSLLARW